MSRGKRKSQTPYDPKHLTVESTKGSLVTATRGNKRITRNSSLFKKVESDIVLSDNSESDEEDLEIPTQDQHNPEPEAVRPHPGVPRRYPTRARATPKHFEDFVIP